jgi:hypothetical protein
MEPAINHPCPCGNVYHHCAEIVQAGGSVVLKDWQLIFTCVCGAEIEESDLWQETLDDVVQ